MVSNPLKSLGRVTDPTPPPQSAEYTIATYGRSGLADSEIAPMPIGPAPRQGASPPRGGFRSTLRAPPGKSRPCAVHSTRVRSCRDFSQTPAPPGGSCPGNISTSSPPERIGVPVRAFSNSPVSGFRFGTYSGA
ncbi:hypothetical protein BCL69_10833 [Nitrosomonas communis]|uniref:Uncharacterized protein n=1 Tax=Nitrosomonas communis TaxID=44574 RepID=A0A5D3Y7B8_9PROT|nr:hypothetical protein BCL69_10833 [Nitrosomonas communis]